MKGSTGKRLFWLIVLIHISSIAFSQADSSRLVPVKAWQLSRLIDATVLGRQCDSVLVATVNALELSTETNASQTALLKEVETSRDLWKLKSSMQDTLLTVRDKIHEKDLKQEKKKGFRRGVILSGAIYVGVKIAKLLISK
jgi:hypothetical protein